MGTVCFNDDPHFPFLNSLVQTQVNEINSHIDMFYTENVHMLRYGLFDWFGQQLCDFIVDSQSRSVSFCSADFQSLIFIELSWTHVNITSTETYVQPYQSHCLTLISKGSWLSSSWVHSDIFLEGWQDKFIETDALTGELWKCQWDVSERLEYNRLSVKRWTREEEAERERPDERDGCRGGGGGGGGEESIFSTSLIEEVSVHVLVSSGGTTGKHRESRPRSTESPWRWRRLARPLSCNPELIIADEPTTSLDVTVQAQVLEILADLRSEIGTAVMIITHNLGVVARYVDRVNVMYAGALIETGPTDVIYAEPKHPYTLGLLASVPRLDRPRNETVRAIKGLPPNMARLPRGCAFAPRCDYAMEQCKAERPVLENVGGDHYRACFLDVDKLKLWIQGKMPWMSSISWMYKTWRYAFPGNRRRVSSQSGGC